MREQNVYDEPVVRQIDLNALATITKAQADAGEVDGLQGNQQYRDIRYVSWTFVAEALERESALFERFARADDLDQEDLAYRDELDDALFPDDDLWGLDIGVIGAVLALSALGALTVSSCNAGGFGGRHVEAYPLVVMYLPRRCARETLAIAEIAEVGLDMLEGGLVRLYGRTDFDLHRFARIALARHLERQGDATLRPT